MNITKSGIYASKDISDDRVLVGDNIEVYFFDNSTYIKKFQVGENSQLHYFSLFIQEKSMYDKTFITMKSGGKIHVHSFIFAREGSIKSKIFGEVGSNNSKIFMDIISFAGNNGNVKIDGTLKINKGLEKVGGHLNEDNIFLGSNATISGFPILLVETNDVEASHACKMEKISDEKLFYLRSRGIGRENALSMIIESYTQKIFGNLKEVDSILYGTLMEKIEKMRI